MLANVHLYHLIYVEFLYTLSINLSINLYIYIYIYNIYIYIYIYINVLPNQSFHVLIDPQQQTVTSTLCTQSMAFTQWLPIRLFLRAGHGYHTTAHPQRQDSSTKSASLTCHKSPTETCYSAKYEEVSKWPRPDSRWIIIILNNSSKWILPPAKTCKTRSICRQLCMRKRTNSSTIQWQVTSYIVMQK